jgi:hypothetical protein
MLQKITLLVISFHLCLVLSFPFFKKKTKLPPHITIHTFTQKTAPTSSQPHPRTPKQPGKTPSQPHQPPSEKQPPKKNITTKPKPSTPMMAQPVAKKKSTPPKQKQLSSKVYQEINESLEKIAKNVYSTSNSNQEALKMQTFSNTKLSSFDTEKGYDELSKLLKNSLTLPEMGEVVAKITINRAGVIEKVVVIKTNSKKNQEYLEKNLPLLQFPFVSQNEKTLTLIFCNET